MLAGPRSADWRPSAPGPGDGGWRALGAGRVIGKAEDEAIEARLRAVEEANPKLKALAGRVDLEP